MGTVYHSSSRLAGHQRSSKPPAHLQTLRCMPASPRVPYSLLGTAHAWQTISDARSQSGGEQHGPKTPPGCKIVVSEPPSLQEMHPLRRHGPPRLKDCCIKSDSSFPPYRKTRVSLWLHLFHPLFLANRATRARFSLHGLPLPCTSISCCTRRKTCNNDPAPEGVVHSQVSHPATSYPVDMDTCAL